MNFLKVQYNLLLTVKLEIYQRIPVDVDVLLTHSPPNGILDLTRRDKHAGCSVLAHTLPSLQQCRLHVFGHIHESHGAVMNPVTEDIKFGGISVNAAMQRSQETQAIIVDLKS
jgi:Icc-related predicted phosphoesterase